MAAGFSITITAIDGASSRIEAVNKRLAAMRAPVERLQKQLTTFSRLSGLQQVGQGFQRMAQGAFSAFQSIARIVAPLGAITGAASVAGMYRLVEAWGQWGSQLGFAATRIGITADQLQAFQGAALIAGASSGAMTSGLQALGQSMYDAIGGRAPATVALFNLLGIAFDDGTRHARSVAAVLPQVADRIAAIKNPLTQARVAAQLFGGASEELLPFLRLGSAGIRDLEEKSRRYGVTNQAGIAAANQMRVAQADLTLATQGLTNSIAERLAPIISPLLDQMANWIARNREWIATGIGEKVKEFADWVEHIDFKAVLADVKDFATQVNGVAQGLGGWKRVLEGIVAIKLAGWAGAALGPMISLLRLMALIPGSGVTAGALAAAGVGTVALTGAGIGDGDNNPQARFRVPRPGGPAGYGGPRIRGASNPSTGAQKSALDYFQSQGWSLAQSAGIVANLQAESDFVPSRSGDGGAARGIGQWHLDRQVNFAKLYGHAVKNGTLDEQLAFVQWELTHTEKGAGDRLRGLTSATDAGAAVSRYYERPAAADEAATNRGTLAAQLAAAATGSPGATGKVDLTIRTPAGTQTVARATGNVNAPKIVTTSVGAESGV